MVAHIPPSFVYRFRSAATKFFWDELDKVVNESKIFLVRLEDLNDPFESLPYYFQNSLQEIRAYLKSFERAFGKGKTITGLDARALADFFRVRKRVKTTIMGGSVEHARYIESLMSKAPARLRWATKAACFSESWDSLLMWSHYADGHKGVCIEYAPQLALAAREGNSPLCMSYQDNRPTISTLDLMEYIAATNNEDNVDFFNRDRVDRTFDGFAMTKSSDWSYEREWRYSVVDDSPHGYRVVQALKPVSILIGANVSADIRERIIQEFSGRIAIEKVFLKADCYALARSKINDGQP